MGRSFGLFIQDYLIVEEVHLATYAVIGAASVLAGYSRLSLSLAVMMLETTANVNLFLPIVGVLFVSNYTGGLFNKSLYQRAIKGKNFPFLLCSVP